MNVLVTGGAGFIGTHTCVELLENGVDIVVMDNYSNSSPDALRAVEKITGKTFPIYECDMLDYDKFEKIFEENKIDAVIHFAGLKAVGGTTNPYGTTKYFIEQILRDVAFADESWSIALLRYFNPIGAHESGLIGENPNGIPNNLMPYIARVAAGQLECLSVYGDDYPTRDGTGVRDYIHVCDLANGHLKALQKLETIHGAEAYNLGTGNGSSVLEVVHAFEKASGRKVNYKIAPRRPGDIAECYADASKAKRELGWEATRSLDDMCRDSWHFIEVSGQKK